MKGFSVLLLSAALGWSVIKTVYNNTIPLLGPRMCRRLCQQTVGCFNFKFSAKDLSCNLPFENVSASGDSFLNMTLGQDKDSDVAGLNMRCPPLTRKFYSRDSLFSCRVPGRVWSSERKKSRATVPASLLVFNPMDDSSTVKRVFLNNHKLTTFKMLTSPCEMIHSFDYVRPNRFMTVCGRGRQLHIGEFVGNDFKQRGKPIDTRVKCSAVAEDRLFYTLGTGRALKRITTVGKHPTLLKTLNFKPNNLLCDLKRSVLYATDDFRMRKLNYNGDEDMSFRKPLQGVMCLEPHGDTLYISPTSSGRIDVMSLADYRVERLVTLKVAGINSLSVLKGTVYAVADSCEVTFLGPHGHGRIKLKQSSHFTWGCYGSLIPQITVINR